MTRAASGGRPDRFDLIVDVRTKIEYWLGHLPGAVCIPVDRVVRGIQELDAVTPDSRIFVYCASGARSADAARALRGAGYRRVVDGGGMSSARQYIV